MDFSKFSDADFDLKDWINGAFRAQKETNQNAEVNLFFLIFSYICHITSFDRLLFQAIFSDTRHQASSLHTSWLFCLNFNFAASNVKKPF
jgi:hypothetical protein